MKNEIEKRAENAYPYGVIDLNESAHLQRGYIRGANEQLNFDINAAWSWIRNYAHAMCNGNFTMKEAEEMFKQHMKG